MGRSKEDMEVERLNIHGARAGSPKKISPQPPALILQRSKQVFVWSPMVTWAGSLSSKTL